MNTPLACLNLWHEKLRSGVAVTGVAFAIILILMQLGFFVAVLNTATRVYDQLDFDILLTSPDYLHMSKAGTIPRQRLFQAASLPEVESVKPLYVGFNLWLNEDAGRRRGILVMGIQPEDKVFRSADIQQAQHGLHATGAMLLDNLSRQEFQPREPGTTVEVGKRRLRNAGQFRLGTGFSADGAILVSQLTFGELFPGRSLDSVSLGLVKLKDPSQADRVAKILRNQLPEDVQVFTRDEINLHESTHWVVKTSVGIIFGLGVVVAFFVGIAIVSQVLSSDIARRLPEFATLKAMGYSSRYLNRVILAQANILALVGFVPGYLIAEALFFFMRAKTNLPMYTSVTLFFGVLAGSVVMCSVAGMLALRKLNAADPADLF